MELENNINFTIVNFMINVKTFYSEIWDLTDTQCIFLLNVNVNMTFDVEIKKKIKFSIIPLNFPLY